MVRTVVHDDHAVGDREAFHVAGKDHLVPITQCFQRIPAVPGDVMACGPHFTHTIGLQEMQPPACREEGLETAFIVEVHELFLHGEDLSRWPGLHLLEASIGENHEAISRGGERHRVLCAHPRAATQEWHDQDAPHARQVISRARAISCTRTSRRLPLTGTVCCGPIRKRSPALGIRSRSSAETRMSFFINLARPSMRDALFMTSPLRSMTRLMCPTCAEITRPPCSAARYCGTAPKSRSRSFACALMRATMSK